MYASKDKILCLYRDRNQNNRRQWKLLLLKYKNSFSFSIWKYVGGDFYVADYRVYV